MARVRYHQLDVLRRLLADIVSSLGLDYIDTTRVFVVISTGSKTSAYARIWGVPRPLVEVGACKPAYVIELVAENIVELSCKGIVEVLVHELLHIPRTFSGGLRSHGEWSKHSNISRVAAGIPGSLAEKVCKVVRETVRELVGSRYGKNIRAQGAWQG